MHARVQGRDGGAGPARGTDPSARWRGTSTWAPRRLARPAPKRSACSVASSPTHVHGHTAQKTSLPLTAEGTSGTSAPGVGRRPGATLSVPRGHTGKSFGSFNGSVRTQRSPTPGFTIVQRSTDLPSDHAHDYGPRGWPHFPAHGGISPGRACTRLRKLTPGHTPAAFPHHRNVARPSHGALHDTLKVERDCENRPTCGNADQDH